MRLKRISRSATFTASVHDTIFDMLIAHKAIEVIAMSWNTQLSSLWAERVESARNAYASGIEGLKAAYDADEDGVPERPGEDISTQIRFTR